MIYLRELTQYLSQGLGTNFSRSAGAARQRGQTNTHYRLYPFSWGGSYSTTIQSILGSCQATRLSSTRRVYL